MFPKSMGRRISASSSIREDSNYDDEFVVKEEDTLAQIQTAKELVNLAQKYIENIIKF